MIFSRLIKRRMQRLVRLHHLAQEPSTRKRTELERS